MTNIKPAKAPDLVRVVRISPGASSEAEIRAALPADYNVSETSVSELINYVLSNVEDRHDVEIADRIKGEMQERYGISVSSGDGSNEVTNVNDNETVGQYFLNKTSERGQNYLGLSIVVAAKQEGGLEYRL